jgi:hypothetical protein
MKRIALLGCALLLVVANTAEARRRNRTTGGTYYIRPVQVAPANSNTAGTATTATTAYKPVVTPATTPAEALSATTLPTTTDSTTTDSASAATGDVATASATTTTARTVSYSTSTAQGVANLMAAYNRVGHFGGNPGYEGCGCGATPAAAYSICCYGNSGMATVDVGYAQGSNGMWYCCRRYR